MSVRWIAVQYVGDVLRLPIVNESDMGKPFGSSVLEREVKRIVVNPFSDSPQTFVPESENDGLREVCADLLHMAELRDPEWLHWPEMHEELRKLGVDA